MHPEHLCDLLQHVYKVCPAVWRSRKDAPKLVERRDVAVHACAQKKVSAVP